MIYATGGILPESVGANLTSLPRRWRVRHNVSRAVRGAGYWKWKPFYLLKRLAKLGIDKTDPDDLTDEESASP